MKVFNPRKSMVIDASSPHPDNTQYKISIGDEEWDGESHLVVKVQIMYNGKVAGRKSPSYPIDSDDYMKVCETINTLVEEFKR